MSTFGAIIAQLFGWLGSLVEWVVGFVPVYTIVRENERGVMYVRGEEAWELGPGVHWYIPNFDEVETYNVARQVIAVNPLPLETADDPPKRVAVGVVVTGHVTDVLMWAVQNEDANEGMAEVAEGELRAIVTGYTWDELRGSTGEGRLEAKLSKRMGAALERFGFTTESCRPAEQVTLDTAAQVFGVDVRTGIWNNA